MSQKIKKKIILGSAQFGFGYGITNKSRISKINIHKIMKLIKNTNIKFIDTAQAYGSSEKILGNYKSDNLKIVTKIKIERGFDLIKKVKLSLKRLKVNKIYALIIHNPNFLNSKNLVNLKKQIDILKQNKIIQKFGISVYNINEFTRLKNKLKIDILQIPLSIFDRRFLKNNFLDNIKKKKIEIHARSVFLQGILLLNQEEVPKKFSKWKKIWLKWDKLTNRDKLEKMNACLSFILNLKQIDKLIIGVNSFEQLKEIIYKFQYKKKYSKISSFTNDINLINPTLWS